MFYNILNLKNQINFFLMEETAKGWPLLNKIVELYKLFDDLQTILS